MLLILMPAVLLGLAVAYVGYWLYMAGRIQAGIGPWVEARRAAGYDLRWAAMAIGGFPTAFRLTFTEAAVASTRPLPIDARAETLIAEARPWDLQRWRLSAPQGVRVAVLSERDAISAATLDGAATLGTDGAATLDLVAHDVTGSGTAAFRVADAEATVTLAGRTPASHRDAALSAALRLKNVALPQDVPALGATVDAVTFSGSFKGSLPPGKLRQSLARWRDDGGTIELENGSLRWGPLKATANGTLALDAALQPIAALTATVENQDAIVDAAVAGGALREGDGQLAKIVLGLMAKPGPDGTQQLTLPLRVQDDRVFLGPARIAALPRFTWE